MAAIKANTKTNTVVSDVSLRDGHVTLRTSSRTSGKNFLARLKKLT